MSITREWVHDNTDMCLGTVQIKADDLLSLLDALEDLRVKVQFLLNDFVSTPEGTFTFPDGDTWEAEV